MRDLAGGRRARIATYLDERAINRPATTRVFVSSCSAWRDTEAGRRWVSLTIGDQLTVKGIREDRILHQAHPTRADSRARTDLFGLSTDAACRCSGTVKDPGFGELDDRR